MRTESKLHRPPVFAPSEFEERTIRFGGSRLRYLAGGAGEGLPVVLVHGLGGTALTWLGVAPELAAERRILVPDLLGHGRSEPADLPERTLDPYADAVVAVLEAEDAVPAVWVGHSLGGLVGLRAAVRTPDAVAGLVLAASAGIS